MTRQAAATGGAILDPIRVRIPGLLDVVLVRDVDQIRWLNQRPEVVRPLPEKASWLHRVVNARLHGDLGFHGGVLPVFRARDDAARAERQVSLEKQFENAGGAVAEIADYIAGRSTLTAEEIAVTVQRWCGKLFAAQYYADTDTYAAGKLLAGWAGAPPWRTLIDRWSGRLTEAKTVLARAADGDLHCVHGTSIGAENIVRTVAAMRELAQDSAQASAPADVALRECLVSPPAVLRGCTHELQVPFLDRPLSERTLVVFLVARSFRDSGALSAAFLADSWSRCPAHQVIPEMLRSVWTSAQRKPRIRGIVSSTVN